MRLLTKSTRLYGITILQAYQYFLKYPNDTKVQKGWVRFASDNTVDITETQ